MKRSDPMAAFQAALVAAGGEWLATTNPYETARFRTSHGVGVVYRNARGRETWNAEALAAKAHIDGRKGSLAPVAVHDRRKAAGTVARLIERDGSDCFFCRKPLGADVTVEHLVAVAHGGPNHISNLFLAHSHCNRAAGHLSAPEKIARREKAEPCESCHGIQIVADVTDESATTRPCPDCSPWAVHHAEATPCAA